MLRAILFDLDGTLLDTLPDIEERTNDMLARFGYPLITREQTRSYVGDGARRLVERALPANAENKSECYTYFKEHFAEGGGHTKLFLGEEKCLNRLIAQGLKFGVVTNKPQDAAEKIIKAFFPRIPFEFVGGDSGLFPCKPDPSLALYAALSMRVAPAECAFVGDGETDVKTAINAGMFGVSALWGYRSREQLLNAGATVFAENFKQLEKILIERQTFFRKTIDIES